MRDGLVCAAVAVSLSALGIAAQGDPRGAPPLPGLAGFVESPTTGPNAPRFAVASIKRNTAGAGGTGGSFGQTLPGGQVRSTNFSLLMLIRQAYGLTMTDQVLGGPSWIDTYGFEVDAKPAASVTVAQARLMLRTLLAERFKLVVRREPREQPIYALVLARRDGTLGPQIKRSTGGCVPFVPGFARSAGGGDAGAVDPTKPGPQPQPGQPGRRCGVGPDGDTMKAGSATMTTLISILTPTVDRPIIDRTGLVGLFDFDLRYAGAGLLVGRGRGAAVSPDAPVGTANLPSLFTALQEQLGLRLDAQRGPVDVLAVQSAELPTEN
jgi:uncharacterized protein (TIGR03435 family)